MGQVCITETSWNHEEWNPDEWNDDGSLDEWNDDWSGFGWHEDCEQTYNTFVSSLSLASSEWVNANLDTGATVDTFPSRILIEKEKEMEVSLTGSQMSKVGNLKDMMKSANPIS